MNNLFLFCGSSALNVLVIVLPIVALVIGGFLSLFIYLKSNNRKLGDAKLSAEKTIQEAIEAAKNITKEKMLECKEEIHKQRETVENEFKERKNEIQRSEQRLVQKEESLEKKEESLEKKLENVEQIKEELKLKEEKIDEKQQDVDHAHEKMLEEIEKVSGLTREEAKKELIDAIIDEAKIDAAKYVREIEYNAKEDADKKAKDIISLAIQRCAVDHSSEITVSVVNLPNDDMKGRIIGREGRNIRALENATGVDLIIDDTPEAVVLSGFDPVRREIARLSLEKLISDGRIHPARIEETVKKTEKELATQIKEAGEAAMFEAGVFGINNELIKILGRLKYRTSYGQNVLKHSLEVSHLAGLMASELGADVNIAKRGGLLHDIGKAVDHEVEGTHVTIGVDLAKKFKESKAVIHCIEAHHNDVEPTTIEAILVQCADAISGAKPGARRESLDNYIRRLEKLEGIANGFDGVEKSFAIQAGREVRIIVKPDSVDDAATLFLAKEIAKQIEKEMEYPGQIKVNVIRETRSIEFAK